MLPFVPFVQKMAHPDAFSLQSFMLPVSMTIDTGQARSWQDTLLTVAGAASASVSASSRLHLQGPEAREHPTAPLWPHHADRL